MDNSLIIQNLFIPNLVAKGYKMSYRWMYNKISNVIKDT